MMTPEEDVEAHALGKQGWTISAIARHLNRDRKTVRAYLAGDRQPGVRKPAGDDPFDVVVDYITRSYRSSGTCTSDDMELTVTGCS